MQLGACGKGRQVGDTGERAVEQQQAGACSQGGQVLNLRGNGHTMKEVSHEGGEGGEP